MDTNDEVEKTFQESTSVEEESQPKEQNFPEVDTYQFSEESKDIGNINDDLIDKTTAISKEASTMKKEVEILKIELIVPQRGYIDIGDNKNVSIETDAVGTEAKLSVSNLNTETVEVLAGGQSDMNTVLETVQIQEIDRSVGSMQQEEKLNLHINPDQDIVNASESIGEIVAVGTVAKLSVSNLNTERVEVLAGGQSDMYTVLETVQMQEIDRSVGGRQQEEKLNLHINPDQAIVNASEPIGEIVAVGTETKFSVSNLNNERVEVLAGGQSDMNTVLETVQMQEIDRSVGGMQQEEKLNLHINPEQHIINASEPVGVKITSGLSLLAQYLSDDDADSVVEVPIKSTQDYREQVVEIDSSSESDDSTDSSGIEYLNELSKTIKKRLEADVDEDEVESEDHTGKKKNPAKLRVKGELLLEELPPIQDLKITVPEDECVEFGKIHSIVDQLVLVSALPNSNLMDLDTVLFLERGQKVLGEVFDVLGQVADPLYCVRFNSNKQIKEKDININDKVYVAPKTKYTQYVILSNIMTVRGSDASWENDIEPPPRFLDYSDDEQEQLARRQLRNKDRPADREDVVKRLRTLDEDNSTTNMARRSHSQSYRYPEQRNNRGSSTRPTNANNRPRCEIPHQYQRGRANNHRNSWHSNYYPKPFVSNTVGGYGMHSMQNIPHPPGCRPHVPAYIMPPVHNYPYPPGPPTPYGPPPMFHRNAPQITPMSNAPPPHETPHILPSQEHIITPPPPPGSE